MYRLCGVARVMSVSMCLTLPAAAQSIDGVRIGDTWTDHQGNNYRGDPSPAPLPNVPGGARRGVELGPALEAALRAERRANRGQRAMRENDLAAAETWFRKALDEDAAYAFAHRQLGYLALTRGRFAQAEALERQAIALDGNDRWAHHYLGVALARQGRFAEARDSLRRAERMGSSESQAWLAWIEQQQRYEQLLRQDRIVQQAERRATAAANRGDWSQAGAAFERALAHAAHDPKLAEQIRDKLRIARQFEAEARRREKRLAEARTRIGGILNDLGAAVGATPATAAKGASAEPAEPARRLFDKPSSATLVDLRFLGADGKPVAEPHTAGGSEPARPKTWQGELVLPKDEDLDLLFEEPRRALPGELVLPEDEDERLLFERRPLPRVRRWPGPKNPGRPLPNPLWKSPLTGLFEQWAKENPDLGITLPDEALP